jgi:hypothetical protein
VFDRIVRQLTTHSGEIKKEPNVIVLSTKEKKGLKLKYGNKKKGPEIKKSKGDANKKGVKKGMYVMGAYDDL